MPSTPTSDASTKVESDSILLSDDLKDSAQKGWQRAKSITTSRDILLFLVAFRLLNALTIKTFFQPDEYFQSLEPAWQIAFGQDSGAWITWVCLRLGMLHRLVDHLTRNGDIICDQRFIPISSQQDTGLQIRSPTFCGLVPPIAQSSYLQSRKLSRPTLQQLETIILGS